MLFSLCVLIAMVARAEIETHNMDMYINACRWLVK
jgi:hypothetical protein